ncbi:MAG: Uma2 family endonuclease [Algicola sp.]|nr:Uma2 family endonuclease [Algicola sp.]
MSVSQQQQFISPKEYLAGERISEVKHELIDGQVYAMAGSSIDHQRICANISGEFRTHLKGSSCEAMSSDIQVNVGENYYYPDVMVVCDFDQSQRYFTQSPVIIVEVLSKSTRRKDLTTKRLAYTNIPSLKEYVLIEQDFVNIEVLRKSSNWQGTHYVLGDKVHFESIDLTLDVAEIYERVQNEDMAAFISGGSSE